MSPFSGKVTPTNGPFYYLGSNGAWVAATSSRSYYLNDTDEDYYMADVKGIYGGNTKYYVNANAYIKSSAGIVTDTDGSKYYVKDGGTVKTTAGFVKYNKKTYYVAKTGKIRTAKGKFEANDGKYHLITSSTGSLRVNEGFVTYNNKRYYVTGSNNGALARSSVVTVKEKGKTKHYHMNSSCTTMNGLHTWKGNKYVASHYGVLYSYGVHKLDGKYYFSVNDYGKLKIHDFFT
jgi:hypothetical protein